MFHIRRGCNDACLSGNRRASKWNLGPQHHINSLHCKSLIVRRSTAALRTVTQAAKNNSRDHRGCISCVTHPNTPSSYAEPVYSANNVAYFCDPRPVHKTSEEGRKVSGVSKSQTTQLSHTTIVPMDRLEEYSTSPACVLRAIAVSAGLLLAAMMNSPKSTKPSQAYKAFLDGTRRLSTESSSKSRDPVAEYIERPNVIGQFVMLLKNPVCQTYQIVSGPRGSGKTTAVKEACCLIGQGVIYAHLDLVTTADTEVDRDGAYQHVAAVLAKALGIEEAPKAKNGLQAYVKVEETLYQAATEYKAKHNAPLQLVLDNMNGLQRFRSVVRKLQDFTKRCAEEGLITVVFVTGNELSWFRCGRVLVMPELSSADASGYARKLGVPEEHVEHLVALVGGNFEELIKYGGLLQRGESWADIESALYAEAKKRYEKAWLLAGFWILESLVEYYRSVVVTLQQLQRAEGSAMSYEQFTDLLPTEPQKCYGKLLEHNIINSYDGHTVVFASRHLGVYLKERLLKAHNIKD